MRHLLLRAVSMVTLIVVFVGLVPPASALSAQKKEPRRLRELVEYRTRNAKYFLNDDGSRTVEIYNGPVHVKDSAGKWIDRDYKLKKSRQQFVAGNGEARLAYAELSTGLFASVSDGTHLLEMGLADAIGVAAIPQGDYAVRYSNILRGTDAVYLATAVGFKEEVVLKDRTAPRGFTFLVKSQGLTARRNAGRGEIEICDASGAVVFA